MVMHNKQGDLKASVFFLIIFQALEIQAAFIGLCIISKLYGKWEVIKKNQLLYSKNVIWKL